MSLGSRTPAAPEAPIDNAIEGNNAAVAEIDRLEPKAKLSPTVFTPPYPLQRRNSAVAACEDERGGALGYR